METNLAIGPYHCPTMEWESRCYDSLFRLYSAEILQHPDTSVTPPYVQNIED